MRESQGVVPVYVLCCMWSAQEELGCWYGFVSDHDQHVECYMESTSLTKSNRLLIELVISGAAFICDKCN
jgi:hypothetical protein